MSIMDLLKLAGCCCRPKIGVPPDPPDPLGACCVEPDTSMCFNNKTEVECTDLWNGDWYEDETCEDISELCSPPVVPCTTEACAMAPSELTVIVPSVTWTDHDPQVLPCDCPPCVAQGFTSPFVHNGNCIYIATGDPPENNDPCDRFIWHQPDARCVGEGESIPGLPQGQMNECDAVGDLRYYMNIQLDGGCSGPQSRLFVLAGPSAVSPAGAYTVCAYDSPNFPQCDVGGGEASIAISVV